MIKLCLFEVFDDECIFFSRFKKLIFYKFIIIILNNIIHKIQI